MTKVRTGGLLIGALIAAEAGVAPAQIPGAPTGPTGIMAEACPPPLVPPPEVAELAKAGPKALFESQSPPVVAFLREEDRRRSADRAGLCRYRAANKGVSGAQAPAVVFIGDSITDFWPGLDDAFFTGNRYLGRGIGAQVTSQGLLRFQQDVIELHPGAVHILYGINDIAGLGGPTTYERVENNLKAIIQLARANRIAVVIGTILPLTSLPGGPRDTTLNAKILQVNDWIRTFAAREHVTVADYYPALAAPEGGFRSPELTSDGVHPTLAGYRVMEPITSAAIRAALTETRR